jgi:hypothetical protein
MAFLRKIIDKATYMLIVGVCNAGLAYAETSTQLHLTEPQSLLAVTLLNLFLVWLGVETGYQTSSSSTPTSTTPTTPASGS